MILKKAAFSIAFTASLLLSIPVMAQTDPYKGKTYTHDEIYSHTLTLPQGTEIQYMRLNLKDGLIRVFDSQSQKYGYIDINGKLVIPCQYQGAEDFSDGMALVYYGDHKKLPQYPGALFYLTPAGYIDTKGNQIVDYDYLLWQESGGFNFSQGFAGVMVDSDGDTIEDYLNVIDKNGNTIINGNTALSNKKIISMVPFNEGYTVVNYDTVMDKNGNIVFHTDKGKLSSVSEGLVAYSDNSTGKSGFMDLNGNLVIDCKYELVSDFVNGLARTAKDTGNGVKLYGYINKNGEEIAPQIYSDGKTPSEGLIAVSKTSSDGRKLYGYIDYNGKEVIDFIYEDAASFQDGLAAVKKDGKYGYINISGETVVPFIYNEIFDNIDKTLFFTPVDTGTFTDGKAIALMGDEFVVINKPDPNKKIEQSTATPQQNAAFSAIPTSSNVFVNGKEMSFDAYLIDGNNYFKLRDIAYSLKDSEKPFNVSWSKESNAINIITNEQYVSVGGEMKIGSSSAKKAVLSNADIYMDNVLTSFTSYNIDGNTYFKLRDLGDKLEFLVSWDENTNSILISTK